MNLESLRNANQSELIGIEEMQLPSFSFNYVDSILLDAKENTFIYKQHVLKVNKTIWKRCTGGPCTVRVKTTLKPIAASQTFTNVIVIPYRDVGYSIYHITEGTNTIIQYYLKYGSKFKVYPFIVCNL